MAENTNTDNINDSLTFEDAFDSSYDEVTNTVLYALEEASDVEEAVAALNKMISICQRGIQLLEKANG